MFHAYLVGPDVFHPDTASLFDVLRETCRRHGIEGWQPVDGGLSKGAPPTAQTAHRIYEGNLALLQTCDGVLANVMAFRGAEMDSGSAFEIGHAFASGKPVVGYGEDDGLTYAQRVTNEVGTRRTPRGVLVDVEGLPVEDFGQPLPMVVLGALQSLASSFDQAAKTLGRATRPAATPSLHANGTTLVLNRERLTAVALEPDVPAAQRWVARLFQEVQNASSIVAEVDSFRGFEPSAALALLIGYAVALNKPFDLVLADQRDHGQRVRDQVGVIERHGLLWCERHGWLVEDMQLPVNLMLACPARSVRFPDPSGLLHEAYATGPTMELKKVGLNSSNGALPVVSDHEWERRAQASMVKAFGMKP